MPSRAFPLTALVVLTSALALHADVGDPQIQTEHPWYPGELACSTFPRLFATQARLYERVTGVRPTTDEQKALAAWLWRNTHYYHGEEGAQDLWGKGFTQGGDLRTREYWTGLFAHGFGLCGTTHSQWVAEMEALLGHGRGRGVGVSGHNSFEVFLKGGAYGDGKWALLDHDISTVIFNQQGNALLSLAEVQRDWKRLSTRSYLPGRQQGWLVCGLHPNDGGVYQSYRVAEYLAGYSAVPPVVHLRRGERLRRHLEPGLDDGKTFVFWGRNYKTQGIPGPERSITWVNQPEKMYQSRKGAGFHPGQARYGNATYIYRPNFHNKDYREGVVSEDDHQVTFELVTPYIIAATPANDKPWGIYDPGCRNGLVLHGKAACQVSLSVDGGKTWHDCGKFSDGMDLTDHVKGRQQYLLRLHTAASSLVSSGLTVTTVCQANAAILPRLEDNGSTVHFQASGQAVVAAGPSLPLAEAHVVEGKMGSPRVTLELATPHGEKILTVHAAAHVHSSSPPRPDIKYQIEVSTDRGATWRTLVDDWTVTRRGEEPADFWSQSFCWGELSLKDTQASSVRVRFKNNGGKRYARCEAHLVYRAAKSDPTRVTFAWTDNKGDQQSARILPADGKPHTWQIPTGQKTRTRWVDLEPVPPGQAK